MDRSKDEILKVARSYIDFVDQAFFVEKAFLFGSWAKGNPNHWSDIDIAIVSSDFEHIPRPVAMKILGRMAGHIDSSIEAISMATSETIDPPIGGIVYEVLHSGELLTP
ncbi:MAG: nucleotidyltransferase domain-containing protein [Oligoflexia bacterium]|nr:nucleotidyltransferase domain-containing protein [Oligoflexia bacterium]